MLPRALCPGLPPAGMTPPASGAAPTTTFALAAAAPPALLLLLLAGAVSALIGFSCLGIVA